MGLRQRVWSRLAGGVRVGVKNWVVNSRYRGSSTESGKSSDSPRNLPHFEGADRGGTGGRGGLILRIRLRPGS